MTVKAVIFYAISSLLLIVLAWHISNYIFLTDDAFISFRYAVNFADGHGLVFNIGERVEGYTNFLWVIILSFFSLIGIAPEKIANILSIALSVALFLSVIRYNQRFFAQKRFDLFILIAPLLLVLNRTYAVWSTSGMETKLFSFLVFFSVIYLIKGWIEDKRYLSISSLLFALTSLTRPEGILLAASFFGYYILLNFRNGEYVHAVRPILIYIVIIGVHFLFRLIYYGYIFPNTFYAKVEGFWFKAGFSYLFLFIHEYGLYLLLPLIIFSFSKNYNREKRRILLASTIPFAPYLLYLASIGGDHFEFRPLDITIPFLAIAFQEGFRSGWSWLKAKIDLAGHTIAILYAILALIFYTLPGWLSHRNFSNIYESGAAVSTATSDNFLVKSIPGIKAYLGIFDHVHKGLSRNFVCVRQEEHRLAMEQYFIPQAKLLREAIDEGVIRPDQILCLWCVGAIPYYSGLETIDYLGLTDRHVAHRRWPGQYEKETGLMGHNRRADWKYLVERKVTYVSTRPSVFFFPVEDFLSDKGLNEDKLPIKTYLVPFKRYAFVFRSAYLPQYFEQTLSARDIGFFYRQRNGQVNYYPPADEDRQPEEQP